MPEPLDSRHRPAYVPTELLVTAGDHLLTQDELDLLMNSCDTDYPRASAILDGVGQEIADNHGESD